MDGAPLSAFYRFLPSVAQVARSPLSLSWRLGLHQSIDDVMMMDTQFFQSLPLRSCLTTKPIKMSIVKRVSVGRENETALLPLSNLARTEKPAGLLINL
jgi:hypothetical protein